MAISKREKLVKSLRLQIAESGLTPTELFPGYGLADAEPANPCDGKPKGSIQTCGGVISPPQDGGPWVPVYNPATGKWDWLNGSSLSRQEQDDPQPPLPVEQAPPPRAVGDE